MIGKAEGFVYVHMVGARFHDGHLPLSAVEEFKNYRILLIALAKHLYRNANPATKKLHLKKLDILENDLLITGLHRGSTGVDFSLLRSEEGSLIDYVEESRRIIEEAFQSLNESDTTTAEFPDELKPKLAVMGKSLEEGDTYIWSKDKFSWQDSKAKLTNKTTYNLRNSIENTDIYEDLIHVFIVGVCSDPLTFAYKSTLNSATKQGRFIDPKLFDTLKECTEVANRAPLVALSVHIDSSNDKIIDVINIEHVLPSDWAHRLDELATLSSGWLDGYGSPISREAIRTAETILFLIADEAIERPGIFPTIDGGVHIEWSDENDTEIVIDSSGNSILFSDNMTDKGVTTDPYSLLPLLLESLSV